MALLTSAQAAATAVDVDHIRDQPYRSSPFWRVLRAVAYVGSVNPNDAGVDIWVGMKRVARIYNSRGGANVVPNRDDLMPIGEMIPPGMLLTAPIFDAGLTNQTLLMLDLVDLPPRRRR